MTQESQQPVYVAEAVAKVERLHPYVATEAFRALPVRDQLDRMAETIVAACAAGNDAVLFHIRSWLPEARDRSDQDLLTGGISRSEARDAMAREHGYRDWGTVESAGDGPADPDFERAVDAVVTGDLETLERLLDDRPELVGLRSHYRHRSTLLHYLGANGVETYRQKTPLNAAALADLLIARGADAGATAEMYGSGQTALDLLLTSAHPAAAGVTDAVAAVLRAAGRG